MSQCEACGKPQMAGLKFRVVDGKLLCENCAKGKCEKCGGELKTLSDMVSDDTRHFIKAVKCKKCGHTATLKEPRTAPYKPIRAIV